MLRDKTAKGTNHVVIDSRLAQATDVLNDVVERHAGCCNFQLRRCCAVGARTNQAELDRNNAVNTVELVGRAEKLELNII